MSGKRVLLLPVAGFLSASALLAIGILLFGDFGATEGRILTTTALLAVYGLLALPAAILLDQGRLRNLAQVVVALAAGGVALALAGVWTSEPPEALGKAIGTVTAFLLAATQTAALAARRREQDSRSVRRLLRVSSALVVVVAVLFAMLLWAEIDSEGYGRVLAALVVFDLLLVALQPILARARPAGTVHRLRILVEPGETVELTLEAPDLAAAAAKAIRMLEHAGRRVLLVEVAGTRAVAAPGGRRSRSWAATARRRENQGGG